ncbi:MAG: ATP-dependent helicase, partial [Desulfobulbaceae bacterium]|nr:ATP-dependent helicase [Desulfobulbaceae bacterium]
MTASAPIQIYKPAIATLSDFERIFLQFISIVYEPVSNTFLADCFLKTNILDDGRRPGKDELYASITKFHELKLLNQFNQPQPGIVEYLIRASIDDGNFSKLAGVIEQEIPVSYLYGKWSTRCWRALREFRIGVYSGDFDKIDEAQQFINDQCLEHFDHKTPAVLVAADNFDPKWFSTLPSSLQFFLLDHILRYSLEQLRPITEVIQYLSNPSSLKISELEQVPFHRMLAGHLIYMGRFDLLQKLLTEYEESFLGSGFAGTLTFLKGDTPKALELFEQDLKRLKEFFTDESVFFVGITGVFYLFALLSSNKNNSGLVLAHLSTVLTKYQGSPEETSFRFIEAVVNHSQGVMPDMVRLTEKLVENKRSLTTLFALTCLHWLGVEIPGEYREKLIKLHEAGMRSSLDWLAMEAGFLLGLLGDDYSAYKTKALELHDRLHCRSITEIFVPQNSWKQSLQELINVSSQVREPERTNRLAWFVEFIDNSLHISCKEQKKTTSGKWSKGRSVSLSRLMKSPNLEFLSNQDRKICATLRDFDEENGNLGTCFFDMDKALVEIIGHPHVFLESSPSTPVELVAGEPELMVEQQGESLFICFTQDIGEGNIAIWRETPTRFRIMQINEEHRKVAAITGREGLRVPMEASDQVLDAISKIASFMTVHTSIDIGTYKQQSEIVEPDPTVHIHIIPYGSGFRLEMFVQPFSNVGPYLKPGSGVAT